MPVDHGISLAHSLLLTPRGGRLLARLIPGPHGQTLSTTTYPIIAATRLLALFVLWTPSGLVWWRAEGPAFWLLTLAHGASWLLKASVDAGAERQSGGLAGCRFWRASGQSFPTCRRCGSLA